MSKVNVAVLRARIAVQELGISPAVLDMPGGYIVALIGVIHRHWPHGSYSQAKGD